jgi:hypothetical protein
MATTTFGESSPAGQIWNGSTWKATPHLPTSEIGNAISCVSEKFCFQVNETKNGRTFAADWNGSKWTVVPTPNPLHRQSLLDGVSCSTLKLCVAVGQPGSTTLIEQWDGKTWSIQRSPNRGQRSLLESVSCVRVNVCMRLATERLRASSPTGLNP